MGYNKMMESFIKSISLPFPPSVNSYYRSVRIGKSCRVLISKQGREYKKLVKEQFEQQKPMPPLEGRLVVRVLLNAPTRRKYDLDNRCKALLDSLEGLLYLDDAQIDLLTLQRGEVIKNDGKALITIIELEEEYENQKDKG